MNLEKGNTAVVAEKIQVLTGADIFRLETVKQYPADYMECTQAAKERLDLWSRILSILGTISCAFEKKT